MTTPIVNDVSPRNQYVALQDSTIFIYDFVVLVNSDLDVFLTPVGSAPSSADKLQLTVDYNVDGVGDSNGGNVILTSSANAGDIITIERNSPIQRPTNFNPGDFTVEEMNDSLNAQTTFSQDNEVVAEKLTPSYTPSAIVEPGQVLIPQLGDGEFWIGSPLGDGIIKAKLDQAPDCASLRTDLAVEAEFTNGAGLVGFFDGQPVTGVGPTTVRKALQKVIAQAAANSEDKLSGNNNIVLGGNFSTNPFQEGRDFTAPTNTYIADGWGINIVGTMRADTTEDAINPVPLVLSGLFSNSSLRIETTIAQAVLTAGDRAVLLQPIEGYYFRPVAQQTSFLSFYVRSSIPGIYCVGLVNNGSDTSFVKEYTINVANVWEKKTIEVPPSPAPGNWGTYADERAVTLHFTLAAGVDSQQVEGSWQANGNKIATANQVNFFDSPVGSTFHINLIQWQPQILTPFQQLSREEEIAFAQRYFEKSWVLDNKPGTITDTGMSFQRIFSTTFKAEALNRDYKVSKRAGGSGVTWFSPGTGVADRIHRFVSPSGDFTVSSTVNSSQGETGFPIVTSEMSLNNEMGAHFVVNARMPL